MRFHFVARLLFVALFLPVLGHSQKPEQPPVQRDPQALAILQNSIAAMGGLAAAAQVTDTVVMGNVQPAASSSVKPGTFTWKTAGPDFRYEKQSATASQVFVSGHGQPASIRGGAVTSFKPHITLANPPLHLPALFLTTVLGNKQYSVNFVGKADVNGAPAVKVRISLDTDPLSSLVTPQDWYFDAASAIPLRVEHRLPDNRRPENFVLAADEFADFRVVAGLLVPFKITSYEEGKLVAVETVTAVSFNNGLTSSEFDAPTGGAQ